MIRTDRDYAAFTVRQGQDGLELGDQCSAWYVRHSHARWWITREIDHRVTMADVLDPVRDRLAVVQRVTRSNLLTGESSFSLEVLWSEPPQLAFPLAGGLA